MKNGLYHMNVWFPEEIKKLVEDKLSKQYIIRSTNHSRQRADEYNLSQGCIRACLFGNVIEAEIYNNEVVKIVTRIPHRFDKQIEVCFAIAFNCDTALNTASVKTIWLNDANNSHSTLDKSKYVHGFVGYYQRADMSKPYAVYGDTQNEVNEKIKLIKSFDLFREQNSLCLANSARINFEF